MSIARQLIDLPTVVKNTRDMGRIIVGYGQSLHLLRRVRPDIVFAKGGYVCLPLGLAARSLRIPIVIHDSDTRPGLTNTVLSRFAVRIATGSPLENYTYPVERSVYTGVPIDAEFHPVTAKEQRSAKSLLKVAVDKPLIVAVGGGLGARSINDGVIHNLKSLLDLGVSIYHVTGKGNFDDVTNKALQHEDYTVVPFVYQNMHQLLAAADIVVTRASATFLQELAALKKPVIVVPAKHLADQNKNAIVYKKAAAAIVLDDDTFAKTDNLSTTVEKLLDDQEATQAMASRLHAFAMPHAAADVAQLIVDAYTDNKGRS